MLKQQIQAALGSWQQWSIEVVSKPAVIEELTGGKTNRSFLIELITPAEPINAVLRINSRHSEQLGINRKREKYILHQVAKAGFAPDIYYNNLEILVSEFLPGKVLTDYTLNKQQLNSYHQLLQNIHNLPVDLPPFSYKDHSEHYWQQLITLGVTIPESLAKSRNNLLAIFPNLEATLEKPVLCHHDAGLHNLLESNGKLQLIDWEYAALGWADIDLAATGAIKPQQQYSSTIASYINQLWTMVSLHRSY